jgi:hypothetical protein
MSAGLVGLHACCTGSSEESARLIITMFQSPLRQGRFTGQWAGERISINLWPEEPKRCCNVLNEDVCPLRGSEYVLSGGCFSSSIQKEDLRYKLTTELTDNNAREFSELLIRTIALCSGLRQLVTAVMCSRNGESSVCLMTSDSVESDKVFLLRVL